MDVTTPKGGLTGTFGLACANVRKWLLVGRSGGGQGRGYVRSAGKFLDEGREIGCEVVGLLPMGGVAMEEGRDRGGQGFG
jgi:hypothetical protein